MQVSGNIIIIWGGLYIGALKKKEQLLKSSWKSIYDSFLIFTESISRGI